jgi:hypothetical protein
MHLPTFYYFFKTFLYLFGGYYSYFITMNLSVNLVNDSPTLLIVFFHGHLTNNLEISWANYGWLVVTGTIHHFSEG